VNLWLRWRRRRTDSEIRPLSSSNWKIDELPGIFSFTQSTHPESSLIHEDFMGYKTANPLKRYGNVCLHTKIEKGDVHRGFAESDLVFEDTYTMPVVHQAPWKQRPLLRSRTIKGGCTCGAARPVPSRFRKASPMPLGLPMSDIRVTALRVGGHFGGKSEMTVGPIAAMLALKAKRAVKLETSRKEDFLSATPAIQWRSP